MLVAKCEQKMTEETTDENPWEIDMKTKKSYHLIHLYREMGLSLRN